MTIEERYQSNSVHQALAHLIEEMGEAIAAAGKTLRFGPNATNPESDSQETNLEWLLRELADVTEAHEVFLKHCWVVGEDHDDAS